MLSGLLQFDKVLNRLDMSLEGFKLTCLLRFDKVSNRLAMSFVRFLD